MESLQIIDAGTDGSVSFELHVSPNFSNLNDVMHGGAAGVIFGVFSLFFISSSSSFLTGHLRSFAADMATTTALCPVAKPGYWEFMGGVTRSLNISYLRAVPIGTTVRLDSKVVSVGKQMAMIRGTMTSLDGKVTYCTVEHHKVNAPVLLQHRGVRVPWDEEFEREWAAKGDKAKI